MQVVRDKYSPISSAVVFDDYRFNSKQFKNFTKNFKILKSYRIEEAIDFSSYDDSMDWDLGSGFVIYQQFSKKDQEKSVNDFYQ